MLVEKILEMVSMLGADFKGCHKVVDEQYDDMIEYHIDLVKWDNCSNEKAMEMFLDWLWDNCYIHCDDDHSDSFQFFENDDDVDGFWVVVKHI